MILRCVYPLLAVIALLLSACTPRVATVVVTSPPEVTVITATPAPTETETATPSAPPLEEPKVLEVCLLGEPDTLYLYGASQLPATLHVMEALYDGPIDRRDYAYHPVILEKIPSLADGDAVTRTVYASPGDRVVDAEGNVVELSPGVRVRPSGCYTTECEITFENGIVGMERMEVTFALRQDVTWSDGVPLTAKDSEFAFGVASDPGTPGYRYITDRTAAYWATDEWHTKWIGVPGFVDASYALRFFPPLPRHQLEGRSPSELPGEDVVRRTPLGWGPFVLKEWVRGDHITLARNPEYFRADEGLPYLDQVVFKVKTDRWEVAASVISGECDLGTHDAQLDGLLPLLLRLEEQGLVQVSSAPGKGMALMSLAVEPSEAYDRPHIFAQRDVRQAIAKCVDRQALVDAITFGRSVVPDSYLPPAHPLYPQEELTEWTYDLAGGRTLLDVAGWRDQDGDGVREAQDVEGVPDGEPLAFTLLASSDSEVSQETARILRSQLVDCGVRLTIDSRRRWELFAEGPEGPLFGRHFDLAAAQWWFEGRPPCERYLSSEIPKGDAWSGANITGYSNANYDAACRSARRALPGTPGYERHHRAAQVIFSRDVPAVPLFMLLRVAIARPAVKNFELDATSESELRGLESLNIDENLGTP